jgi:transcription elongation GreA/GreB family factor
MVTLPPKPELKAELLRVLSADLETLERAMQAAREGATHEEAKPENDKDTRALEQSYLARGQAMRIEELKTGIADVQSMVLRAFREGQPAALGALVTAEEDGETLVLFLAPHGGGAKIAGGVVQVVTPKSPLGRALLGKQSGDDCEVPLAGRIRALSLVAVE